MIDDNSLLVLSRSLLNLSSVRVRTTLRLRFSFPSKIAEL